MLAQKGMIRTVTLSMVVLVQMAMKRGIKGPIHRRPQLLLLMEFPSNLLFHRLRLRLQQRLLLLVVLLLVVLLLVLVLWRKERYSTTTG
jgi:hypothetical protein